MTSLEEHIYKFYPTCKNPLFRKEIDGKYEFFDLEALPKQIAYKHREAIPDFLKKSHE